MNFCFMESAASQTASVAPRLTIGIPTWNREAILRIQLEALMPHLRHDIELVICDNGSTDGTWQLLEEYCTNTPSRLRCIRNAVNLGADVNYLRVLEFASGEWVWMVGDDDRIDFGLIPSLIEVVSDSPADVCLLLDNESKTGLDVEYVGPDRYFEQQYDELGLQILQVGRILCKTDAIRPLLRGVYASSVGSLHSYGTLYGPVIMKRGIVVLSTSLLSARPQDQPRWDVLSGFLGAWKSSLNMYGVDRIKVANAREIRLRQHILIYIAAGRMILNLPLKKAETNQMYGQFNLKGKAALFAMQSAFRISRPLALKAISVIKPELIPKIKANAARNSVDY